MLTIRIEYHQSKRHDLLVALIQAPIVPLGPQAPWGAPSFQRGTLASLARRFLFQFPHRREEYPRVGLRYRAFSAHPKVDLAFQPRP